MRARITKSEAARQAGVSRRTVIRLAQAGRITQDQRGRVRVVEVKAAVRPKGAAKAYSMDDYVNALPGTFRRLSLSEVAALARRADIAIDLLFSQRKDVLQAHNERIKLLGHAKATVVAMAAGGGGDNFLPEYLLALIDDPARGL